jgi:thiol:disulfide interchange protein DsbD
MAMAFGNGLRLRVALALGAALVLPPVALGSSAQAQPKEVVVWKARVDPADARPGEAAMVVVEATITKPWHIYSATKRADGPIVTTLEVIPNKVLQGAGGVLQPPALKHFDENFKVELEEYEGAVAFGLPVKLLPGGPGAKKATVKVRFQSCNESLCLPPRTVLVPLSFSTSGGAARPDRQKPSTAAPRQPAGYVRPSGKSASTPVDPFAAAATGQAPPGGGGSPPAGGMSAAVEEAKSQGILAFLWLSLSMGFLALLTPCVFPMVPITVSFFAKKGETGGKPDLAGALAYCLGIVGTFTGLGLLLTLVYGARGISNLATNPLVNLGLAVLFVVLAINLFGGFQISLPAALVERAQSGSRRGGFVGPALMGLTFTLTSFTCTVPFVGTILAGTATSREVVAPVLGMLAFSTAFASPFFLLALFPQWLARLPKSGGWLATVKAFMGFVELAAALKFLSNADLVFQWGILTRPAFLSVWSTVAFVAGFYLLGWLRLPHDDLVRVSVPRLGFALASLAAGAACLGAMGGRSLGEMEAFLPPVRYPGRSADTSLVTGGIQWLENYDRAVELARSQKKPLFVNFTGVTCTNCRWMEQNMFTRPEVVAELNRFVAVELYTDREDEESARYRKLEQEFYQTVALPLYAARTPEGEKLAEFSGLTRNPNEFVGFLRGAQQAYARTQPGRQVAERP